MADTRLLGPFIQCFHCGVTNSMGDPDRIPGDNTCFRCDTELTPDGKDPKMVKLAAQQEKANRGLREDFEAKSLEEQAAGYEKAAAELHARAKAIRDSLKKSPRAEAPTPKPSASASA